MEFPESEEAARDPRPATEADATFVITLTPNAAHTLALLERLDALTEERRPVRYGDYVVGPEEWTFLD